MQPPAGSAPAAAWATKNAARTLRPKSRSNVSGVTSANGSGWLAPALTTTASSDPAPLTAARAAATSVRSATITSARAPWPRTSPATRSRSTSVRPTSTTRPVPSRAKPVAIAAPIPRLAPATSTDVPISALHGGQAVQPVRGRQCVPLHVLGRGDRGHRGCDPARALLGQPLVRAGLEELADPQPARVAGGAERRQHVVGADRLVAVGHGRLRAEEERAVVAQVEPVVLELAGLHLDLEVLGGDPVGELDRLGV